MQMGQDMKGNFLIVFFMDMDLILIPMVKIKKLIIWMEFSKAISNCIVIVVNYLWNSFIRKCETFITGMTNHRLAIFCMKKNTAENNTRIKEKYSIDIVAKLDPQNYKWAILCFNKAIKFIPQNHLS